MPGLGYEVADIVEGIWRSVFDVEVVPEDPAGLAGQRVRTGAGIVHISGAWAGSVAIQGAEPLVNRWTTALLGITENRPAPEQQGRALGELARMIGEALTPVLPQPCGLSIPEAAWGEDVRLHLPDAVPVLRSAFRAVDQVFAVTIFQRLPAGTPG